MLGARVAEDALARSKRDFVSFASFHLICSRQDQPRDAILEDRLVKVDEQCHRHVQDLHVTEELRLAEWMQSFDSLWFQEQAAVYQDVKTQCSSKTMPLYWISCCVVAGIERSSSSRTIHRS